LAQEGFVQVSKVVPNVGRWLGGGGWGCLVVCVVHEVVMKSISEASVSIFMQNCL